MTRLNESFIPEPFIAARRCYREGSKKAIEKALVSGSSLLVVGETGSGKTFLGMQVSQSLPRVGWLHYGTPKQSLVDLAQELGVDLEDCKTVTDIQTAIAAYLQQQSILLIIDDAHRAPVTIRVWLERLLAQGQRMLLLATNPPAKDLFLKVPRLELQPLTPAQVRELMQDQATQLGLNLKPSDYARLQERCGGNPMLALRVLQEEAIGSVEPAPDHTQWIDLTPAVIAGLSLVMVVRLVGLGTNSQSLYLLGGVLTAIVLAIRILYYSLPRKSGRLG